MWAPFCRCRGAFWRAEMALVVRDTVQAFAHFVKLQSARAILKLLFPIKKCPIFFDHSRPSHQKTFLKFSICFYCSPPLVSLNYIAMSGGQVDMCFVRWHWSHFLLPGPTFPWSCKLPGDRTPFGAGRWSGYVWALLRGGDGGNIACHKGMDQ